MRRLREHQLVTIEVERPTASIECLVLAIDGNQASLEAIREEQLLLLPAHGKDAMLTFEFRSQLVTLRGSCWRDGTDVHFSVTDRVTVPQRRRYARVDVALALLLTPAGGGGAIETTTRDVSADGVLVEGLLPADEPSWRLRLELPEGAAIECDAVIVRQVGDDATAMRYASISDEDRERLKRFVAGRKREILDELRGRGK